MKIIVIGPSASGKSTLIQHLKQQISSPLAEMDDELTHMNRGTFPDDTKYKHEILAPKVVKKILGTDDIVFFTNADYFSMQDLKDAKRKGFKIVIFDTSLETLQKRNIYRVQHEGYDDLSQYLKGMLKYIDQVRSLADVVIDANQSLDTVATELLKACS